MDQRKRDEWRELLAKYGGVIDPDVFIENARNPNSAFHEDFEWNQRKAAELYYQKRAANLIRAYSVQFNTVSAGQRLYGVTAMPPKKKKIYKSAKAILRTEEEREQVRLWLWSRLRMVVRDIEPFVCLDKELSEIYDYLKPRVGSIAPLKAAK